MGSWKMNKKRNEFLNDLGEEKIMKKRGEQGKRNMEILIVFEKIKKSSLKWGENIKKKRIKKGGREKVWKFRNWIRMGKIINK